MEDKYFSLCTEFRYRMASKAMNAASTEVQAHYNQVRQDMAVLEAEVFLEE